MASVTKKRSASAPEVVRPAKKPTIYDLARLTGVSPGTVSRVLNNRDKVNPDTRERILNAAKELNLRPQAGVRTRQIAILSEPGFTDRIEGYAATLTAHLSFAFSRRNIGVLQPSQPDEELPGMFLDGVVAVTAGPALRKLLRSLEARLPVVFMDQFDLAADEYGVCSDHFRSGYLAAQHFLARGRRRLAYFGGNYRPFAERLAGYRQAMLDAGHTPDERLLALYGPEHAHTAIITRLVRAGADAIFAPGSSLQALECLHLLTYTMGVKVPQEVSLIGGENEGISSFLCPPLTTVEDPLKDMAEHAVAMMANLTSGASVSPRQISLPVRLIERDSVA